MVKKIKIIYNHKEQIGKSLISKSKGLLGYYKERKRFSCDASDISCMGIKNIPPTFDLIIEENNHTKTFVLSTIKRDNEHEIMFWLFVASDKSGFNFQIFND